MAKLATFAIDDTRARSGVWLCYGADLWLRVARMGNPAYQERMSVLQAPLMRGRRDARSIPGDMLRPIVDKAMSEHILLDWRNYDHPTDDPLTEDEYSGREVPAAEGEEPAQFRDLRLETLLDETGELITRPNPSPADEIIARPWQRVVVYSQADAERLLKNRRYQPIRDFVFTQSLTEETFRGEDVEADSGN